jgi:NADP-dependent 3-hydroxy acid dehydrogenase YdfG
MMGQLDGNIAWVTGAGSGIGEAVAIRLAKLGATVVLSGRRREPLADVARRIGEAGGSAWVQAGDLSRSATAERIARAIDKRYGRLDIVVNNAGLNLLQRSWETVGAAGVDAVLGANLSSAFYCALAALPIMRRQQRGLLVHTSSWAGRFVSRLTGPAYAAAKHAVVAMSHSLNMEEFVNGIRSTVLCPAEVATPIMDKRPQPVSAEERARMLQPEDMATLVEYVVTAPAHVCINEVLISPAWNRSYLGIGAPPLKVSAAVPASKSAAGSRAKKAVPKKPAAKKPAAKKRAATNASGQRTR